MKKLICLLFAAVMLLPLVSCVSSSPKGTAIPTQALPTDALPTEAESLVYNPETDADNRYLNVIGVCITELKDAFIVSDWDRGRFYYYDKETGDSGVLCYKPECDHTSVDCAGAAAAEKVVWNCDGKLYWMSYGGGYGEDGKYYRYIFRMNPDSTNREIFMTIREEPETDGRYTRIFHHRGKIFMERAYQTIKTGTPVNKYCLSVCDFETHNASEQKIILEFEPRDTTSMNIIVYCLGSRVYLLSNYYDGNNRLMIWMYNIEEEELSIVAEVPLENDDIFVKSLKVTPEGEIYVGSLGNYDGQPCRAYKVADNRLESFIEFDDEEFIGTSTYVCEDTVIAIRQLERNTARYKVWVKDYEGNTLYKGELPTGFRDGRGPGWKFVGFHYIYASRDRILFQMKDAKLNDTTQTAACMYFIEYDITENGLVEKPLIVAEG